MLPSEIWKKIQMSLAQCPCLSYRPQTKIQIQMSLAQSLPLLSQFLTIGDLARIMRVCKDMRDAVLEDYTLFWSIARATFGWKNWKKATFASLRASILATSRCKECGIHGSTVVTCRLVSGRHAQYCARCTQTSGGFRQLVTRKALAQLILTLEWRPKSPDKILDSVWSDSGQVSRTCLPVRITQHSARLYWAHQVIDAFNHRRVRVGFPAIDRNAF